jgi:hypothetical protein
VATGGGTAWTSGLAAIGVTSLISCPLTSGPDTGGGEVGRAREAATRRLVALRAAVWCGVAAAGCVEVVGAWVEVVDVGVVELVLALFEVLLSAPVVDDAIDFDLPGRPPAWVPLLFFGPVGVCDLRFVPAPDCG